MIQNFMNEGLVKKEFLQQWYEGTRDTVLAEHFLFSKDHNDKLRNSAKPFLDSMFKPDESESGSDSGKDSDNED